MSDSVEGGVAVFRLEPVFKDYLWGGEKLRERFNKRSAPAPLAESWELSSHPDGDCVIADGPFAGRRLSEYLVRHPEALGCRATPGAGLSVIIKLIDAREDLSVQVHPGDLHAAPSGARGKTEMWHVLDCEPEACLYCGFEARISEEELRARIEYGTLQDALHRVYVEPGDSVFISAGTVHAIGSGIVLAEIQQSSNTTYRLYDYGRIGPDGRRRPLHIEEALAVAERGPANIKPPGGEPPAAMPGGVIERLVSCPYFTVDLLALSGRHDRQVGVDSFLSVLCLEGDALLDDGERRLKIVAGDSLFVPAVEGHLVFDGEASLLLTGAGSD